MSNIHVSKTDTKFKIVHFKLEIMKQVLFYLHLLLSTRTTKNLVGGPYKEENMRKTAIALEQICNRTKINRLI